MRIFEIKQQKDTNKKDMKNFKCIALFALLLLTTIGCSSKRQMIKTQRDSVEVVVVQSDSIFHKSEHTDSTLHVWDIRTIRSYRNDGTLEHEEIAERHTNQKALTKIDSTTASHNEEKSVGRDYQITDEATEVDSTPIVQTSRNWARIVWGVVTLAGIVVAMFLIWRYKIYRNNL